MTYQAVIFDLFGTLIDNFRRDEFAAIVGSIARRLGAPEAPFMAAVRPLIPASLTGAYDIAGEAVLACQSLGVPCTRDQAVAAVAEWRTWALGLLNTPRPGALDTLVEVRRRGLRTGLISDCADDIPVLWPQSAFAALIDAPVFSCREGVAKPAVSIYLAACERLKVAPGAALYLGDTADEVAGAQAAGLGAVRILAAYETAATHLADRSDWEGPTISALPNLLGYLATT